MFELFNDEPANNAGKIILPQFIYLRGVLDRDIGQIINYYQNEVTSVPNEHLLVKFLMSLNVSMKRDLQNYIDTAGDVGMMVAQSMRLTSSLGYGSIFSPGPFYGRKTEEIVIIEDSPFDIYKAQQDWRALRPVRVLSHPFTDMSLGRCNGNYNGSTESGIAVIAINVAMLALQYRCWYEQERQPDPSEAARTVHQFVSMYPITNMIYSHVDVAFFNRLVAQFLIEKVAPYRKCHPFFVVDISARVDAVIEQQLQVLESSSKTFDQILSAVPGATHGDLRDVIRMPRVIPTRQVKWAMIVARLQLIRFLVQMNVVAQNPENSWYLGKIRQDLRLFRNERAIPHDVMTEVETTILNDIAPYL